VIADTKATDYAAFELSRSSSRDASAATAGSSGVAETAETTA
jgi:hypothetical protein